MLIIKKGRLSQKSLDLQAYKQDFKLNLLPLRERALMLVCARLGHVAGTQWGAHRYMNMDHLTRPEDELLSSIIAG